jgi:PBP1b-binding outer membrane lipoprotein LpoB
MARYLVVVIAAVLFAGCATVQARKAEDGKTYTCVPNNARDRGPFEPTPPAGTPLVVK